MKNENFSGYSRRQFIHSVAVAGTGLVSLAAAWSPKMKTIINPSKSLIIDAHCHAWDYWPYEPSVSDPETHGSVEQLIDQMNLWNIEQATIVAAQIEHNPTNNVYVAAAVQKYMGRLHQFADVDSVWSATYHRPGAAKRMEAAVNQFNPKGFTHYISASDDGTWLNTQEGMDFFKVAAEAKLIASIACYPHHQAAIRRIAEKFPAMPILCHHMSGLKADEQPPYDKLEQVLKSSELPNIYLKLSGFAYVANEKDKAEYPYLDARWIYRRCYEKFGKRMVWGSDYPVVSLFMTYQQSLEAFRKHCDFVSPEDKPFILGGTLNALLNR